MINTMVQAGVPAEKWDALKSAFQAMTRKLPPQIVGTYLVQGLKEQHRWCLITLWRSPEALMEYREAVGVPEGIQMFRDLGIEPEPSINVVVASAVNG
jgi:hypothetical protein